MKSIIQTEKICYFCGAVSNLESHHIFFGEKNRKWSEKYGLKVWLCHYDHRDNLNGVHGLAAQRRNTDIKNSWTCLEEIIWMERSHRQRR